jgi:HEAT repeat protein
MTTFRRRIILVGLLFAVTGGLLWFGLASREPSYQGKSLTTWIKQYQDKGFDPEARVAIQHCGTNSIPLLLRMLATRESPLRVKLTSKIPTSWLTTLHIPDVAAYRQQVDARRTLGAYGIAAFGEQARPFVPALIALLDNKSERVRYLAVFTLRCLGPAADAALPSLIKCLTDPDFFIKCDSVTAMGTIHEQPELVVPLVMSFLEKNRSDLILRSGAIQALGDFNEQAKPAVPMLRGFLYDPDPQIRSQATNALRRIDPSALPHEGAR